MRPRDKKGSSCFTTVNRSPASCTIVLAVFVLYVEAFCFERNFSTGSRQSRQEHEKSPHPDGKLVLNPTNQISSNQIRDRVKAYGSDYDFFIYLFIFLFFSPLNWETLK